MKKLEQLYEGKAKKVFATDDPNVVLVDYKDDATAFNGLKKGTIMGKGVINNRVTNFLMKMLEKNGIPTHYIEEISDRETLVKKVHIVPLEVIVRNIAAGSLSKRLGLPEGTKLKQTVLEYCYKDDELGDPMVNEYHIMAMGWVSKPVLDQIAAYALRINELLTAYLKEVNIELIDFKLEFGRYKGRVLLADEIDRYPKSAGTEGDPLDLAKKRQTTFWDYKTVMVSTPTIKGDSRIEDAYLLSTQEEWNVPCPECGAYQPFLWENVKFDKDDLDKGIGYVCRECGCVSNEYRWKEQGKYGKYVAANPGAESRGFHLNTLASTFVGWKEIVTKFIEAKIALDHGNPEQMKVWVNTELGETWEERGIQLEDIELFNRREIYAAEVPDDVLYLTAGVDVQDDRFEVEVVGWGEGTESWGVRYQKIFGDMLSDQVWDDLDNFLLRTWHKADGTAYPLLATCIDSGGHHTDEVYRFAKERLNRRIFAIKGMGGAGVPFIRNPSKNNRVRADLFILGVDAGKTTIYQRLEVKTPGPNYCHFPSNEEAGYTEEYFKGLTAEKKVVRFVKGHLKEYWEIKDKEHKRNEPLDLRNYATAALAISRPVLKKPDADGTPAQPVKKSRGRRQLSGGI